ncbi:bifunctional phosphatase PAP2/diacylglycerol kinase family protein [Blastococcus sp. Marseille-P5729]|uniref:bifunctional phosphatase PAP2/diacylglycerol kinase family protein n=1 Tax=Blastococcus sp. Marseille-P5729 TaxID=2086582 RepID=UPI000D10431F|nr:bifunctional phosphatase PAP2/diacylglycerol kinase family protein [Blastococcus sp. Marseille-P5729]
MSRYFEPLGPGVFDSVARWDEDVYDKLANADSRVLDVSMPALSRAADYSMLWMAAAAAMRAFGGRRTKRAAGRAIGTLAVSSLVTNQCFKRLHWRNRPNGAAVPLRRRAKRMPTSSSFPSGHSASAAAFSTAVALENLPVGAALGILAAGVGTSRVATGAHYPSDVLTGFAVGSGMALLGAKVVPPVLPVLTDDEMPDQFEIGGLPEGKGLTVIVNEKAGVDRPPIGAEIRHGLPQAEIITLEPDVDLIAIAEDAVRNGAKALGVCGGDGTVVAIAEVAMRHDLPLAVFPGGTFNHFAKDIRVPDVATAIEAVKGGVATKVDVATLNDKIFLNTASVGTYPEFVTGRERLQPRYGKRAAAVVAAYRLLKEKPQVHLRIDGRPMTSMLFSVGNGQYQPLDFAPALRPNMADGKLDVRILASDRRAITPRLLWATLTGTLDDSRLYQRKTVSSMQVEVLESEVLVSRDGEVDDPAPVLRFGVKPRALTVFQPKNPKM